MRTAANHPLLKLALFVLIVCLIVTFVNLQLKFNSLRTERDILLAEIEASEERIAAIQNKIDTPFDEEYVIGVAREKLHLRLPEEIVFFNNILK